MEDQEIVRMYQDRNEAAVRETERKYGSRCRGIAYDIVKNMEDCEECVNDSYLSVWQSIPPQRPLHLSAYLFRIVRNTSIARLREKNAQKRGSGEISLVLDELQECVSSGTGPEEEISAKELRDEIGFFVSQLPKNDRLIFTGRYYLTLPVKEIAHRLELKTSYVCTSLCRSREKLRTFLIKEGLL